MLYKYVRNISSTPFVYDEYMTKVLPLDYLIKAYFIKAIISNELIS